eukprot:COSAG01_NODE_942_length_12551_cov_47.129216_8_plen_146_part_00
MSHDGRCRCRCEDGQDEKQGGLVAGGEEALSPPGRAPAAAAAAAAATTGATAVGANALPASSVATAKGIRGREKSGAARSRRPRERASSHEPTVAQRWSSRHCISNQMLAERWLVSYGGLLLYPEPEGRPEGAAGRPGVVHGFIS